MKEISCLAKKIVRAFGWAQLWNFLEYCFHGIPIIVAHFFALFGK